MDPDQQIECVARAFYSVDHDEQTWDLAPERLKEEFRSLAIDAVTMAGLWREHRVGAPEMDAA
jgi:hypothetical protein